MARNLEIAALSIALGSLAVSLPADPYPYLTDLGRQSRHGPEPIILGRPTGYKARPANPAKKSARKRQKKARAITRRAAA